MKGKVVISATGAVVLGALATVAAIAAQDKYTVSVPDGLAFSEFKGYEDWQSVAVSVTETSVKSILANPAMIKAYKEGIPGNGKPFPEGSKIVKIEWIKEKNALSPYLVEVPQTLKSVSFIEKDSKRFPENQGWAYAQFAYDAGSDTFKPSPPLSLTGHECGFACHTVVKTHDYIFTKYAPR
jgi:hypothetical protein